jgi:hypothetical protein
MECIIIAVIVATIIAVAVASIQILLLRVSYSLAV